MNIKELRFQTGLSQSKFAAMFDIPVSTLRNWEQERRTPPTYVVKKQMEKCGESSGNSFHRNQWPG